MIHYFAFSLLLQKVTQKLKLRWERKKIPFRGETNGDLNCALLENDEELHVRRTLL